MAKESDERNDIAEEKPEEGQVENELNELQQLIDEVDQKAKEFEEEKNKSNPDGRLSWNQLYQMFQLIEGYDPRGRKPQQVQRGIINRQYPKSDLFASKLKTNSTEVRNSFVVLNEVMPKFEDTDKAQEFFDKREELLQEYIGVNDISNFTDQEIERMLKNQNKLERFEGEFEHLQSEYEDIADTLEAQQDFKRKPLAKCDFDLITKQDTAGTGLSANELRILDPMLKF
ncbi:hypothetical protein [Fodinibius sp.]|uniref:hypothetical protein n=1 Tax=Fodinibius sp. TaxID=1872440 RepID=UPI002ACEC147|nr:hypothetical protein [Fodinibius sp.]MDZ7658098.1 hypothetical protein [Fodinibius sp.]